ncbi:Ribosomal protein S12 methylthiotransferase RimO [uncultured Flavonifractor sp.]|uniref:30S ribosomal protein S12 methylthiotransferase RimO n=1 Tax=Eubacteriales TaxID=186802 RepID=UPI00082208E9|nr:MULTISPECIES: 30S ribosomal protein S12 methylthiotransferase RimO [Oscillospiraceae]MBS5590434.1 30S ribosomal protein S12 methylthiotransferase RimO [Clostridiales bacterium]SCH22489.1 Ribosomal protein S12 methylthiotransferase RimO [uncultured Clostridium sp.]SCI29575.1 Ribosomal protein S12 methylthiotransferase RimO [uncultured Flavonifractor sp.]MCH1979924.1 30S ribosomal protein S12 methylthiotransferase RimO [Lawsonibacter sp. OA9]MCU6702817.1 30S ribosomal protein S12 methylthiotr
MTYKVAFVSLGCAKNLVNTEQMMALCRQAGHIVTGDPEGADVAVLNTCGFIESAKSEAIDNILELAQLKDQGKLKKLLVAGCLSQRYPDDIRAELPEVDGMLGTGSYSDVVAAVEELMEGEKAEHFGNIHRTYEDGERIVTTPPYTAYLKIAEGCSNGCAFCIIPKLRGRYRSRTVASLVAEAKKLAASGVKELIVIAQDITRYGLDLEEKATLAQLLKELCRLDFHWIRLHYLYPEAVTDELIQVIASEPKILHYLDIPIQHCNDNILKAMRRRNTKAEIRALFAKLRAAMPDVVIRTSLICGLPGEGEEEFEELCAFLREEKIQRAGVFQFSPEEGTLAAAMEDQVDGEVAARRVELVVDLQSRIMDSYNEERLGTVMEVLCEGFDSQAGCYVGRTYADSVDIDGHVYFTAAGLVPAGEFVKVRITGVSDGDLTGEIED